MYVGLNVGRTAVAVGNSAVAVGTGVDGSVSVHPTSTAADNAKLTAAVTPTRLHFPPGKSIIKRFYFLPSPASHAVTLSIMT